VSGCRNDYRFVFNWIVAPMLFVGGLIFALIKIINNQATKLK